MVRVVDRAIKRKSTKNWMKGCRLKGSGCQNLSSSKSEISEKVQKSLITPISKRLHRSEIC